MYIPHVSAVVDEQNFLICVIAYVRTDRQRYLPSFSSSCQRPVADTGSVLWLIRFSMHTIATTHKQRESRISDHDVANER